MSFSVWAVGAAASAETNPGRDGGAAASDAVRRAEETWPDAQVWFSPREALPSRARCGTRAPYIGGAGARLTDRTRVAVVGTRATTPGVEERLAHLFRALARQTGLPLVSGGAIGVDAVAHAAWSDSGATSAVVLAGGLSAPGPRVNRALFDRVVRDGGTIVSDRPPGHRPRPFDFVRRNALIAALADLVIVAMAPRESGALATAAFARSFGRPVLVVPGAFDDPGFAGCHELLRQGARICTGSADVMAALGRQLDLPLPAPDVARPIEERLGADWTPLMRRVASLARAGVDADGIVRATGAPVAAVQAAILELELIGG